MSVSPTGLDLSPWFIFVCIHFPGVFSWISPVTLRTCIQCWWQKSKSAGDITKDGGVAVSCVFKTPHKGFIHFISYITEYFLKSEIYNCKNLCLYKNRRKLLFFWGGKSSRFQKPLACYLMFQDGVFLYYLKQVMISFHFVDKWYQEVIRTMDGYLLELVQ